MFLMLAIVKRAVVLSREASIVAKFSEGRRFDVAAGVNGVVKISKKAVQSI